MDSELSGLPLSNVADDILKLYCERGKIKHNSLHAETEIFGSLSLDVSLLKVEGGINELEEATMIVGTHPVGDTARCRYHLTDRAKKYIKEEMNCD